MITAKAAVNTKTESGVGEHRQVVVTFVADYNDGRNKEWSLHTPALTFSMTLKGEVADRFKIGTPYLVTFAEEEEEVQDNG